MFLHIIWCKKTCKHMRGNLLAHARPTKVWSPSSRFRARSSFLNGTDPTAKTLGSLAAKCGFLPVTFEFCGSLGQNGWKKGEGRKKRYGSTNDSDSYRTCVASYLVCLRVKRFHIFSLELYWWFFEVCSTLGSNLSFFDRSDLNFSTNSCQRQTNSFFTSDCSLGRSFGN